jgi:hypothetical protein
MTARDSSTREYSNDNKKNRTQPRALSLLSPSKYLFVRSSVFFFRPFEVATLSAERIPGRSMKVMDGRPGAERLIVSS